MRKREHRVTTCYTEDEYQLLQTKIANTGQTMQSYMLGSSLGARLTTAETYALFKEEARILADMDQQLRGIGTNLNQLAHKANEVGYNLDEVKLNEIAKLVVHMRDEVHGRWQSIRQSIAARNLMQE
jgi:hypothetical protein